MPSQVVIVGASAAGLTTAEALRRRGYDGTLTQTGDDRPHPLEHHRRLAPRQHLSGADG
jgi:3-phenylpropionate/trans-cinnamate dioxygenase ferredoxin reductase subunit